MPLPRTVQLLFAHRLLVELAFNLTGIFSVIFLYERLGSLLFALTPLAIVYVVTFLVTPLSARLLNSYGIRNLMLTSLVFLVCGLLNLYGLARVEEAGFFLGFVLSYVVCTGLYKAFYWIPYQIHTAHALDAHYRGRQVAFLANGSMLLVVGMPLIAGFLVTTFGYESIFILGAVFIVGATIPVFFLDNTYEKFAWGYIETFRNMFKREHRITVGAYFGDGIQSGILVAVWPLILYFTLRDEYITIGAVSTLGFLFVFLSRTLFGYWFDTWSKERIVRLGALFSASGWALRLFAGTPFELAAVDAYHKIGQATNRSSMEAVTYELAADSGRYIDEFTALKEVSSNAGRIFALSSAAAVFMLYGVHIGFIFSVLLAILATLATALVARRSSSFPARLF